MTERCVCSRLQSHGSTKLPSSKASKSLLSEKAVGSLELQEALAQAAEYAQLAAVAENVQDKAHYQRMHRKWLGIAAGWRMINDVGKTLR
jgi:hypothetical protein